MRNLPLHHTFPVRVEIVYQRLYNMSLKEYKDVEDMQKDLDQVIEYMEKQNLVEQTLGSHINGKKIYKN